MIPLVRLGPPDQSCRALHRDHEMAAARRSALDNHRCPATAFGVAGLAGDGGGFEVQPSIRVEKDHEREADGAVIVERALTAHGWLLAAQASAGLGDDAAAGLHGGGQFVDCPA
jgi:hypothetical protein